MTGTVGTATPEPQRRNRRNRNRCEGKNDSHRDDHGLHRRNRNAGTAATATGVTKNKTILTVMIMTGTVGTANAGTAATATGVTEKNDSHRDDHGRHRRNRNAGTAATATGVTKNKTTLTVMIMAGTVGTATPEPPQRRPV